MPARSHTSCSSLTDCRPYDTIWRSKVVQQFRRWMTIVRNDRYVESPSCSLIGFTECQRASSEKGCLQDASEGHTLLVRTKEPTSLCKGINSLTFCAQATVSNLAPVLTARLNQVLCNHTKKPLGLDNFCMSHVNSPNDSPHPILTSRYPIRQFRNQQFPQLIIRPRASQCRHQTTRTSSRHDSR